MQTKTEIQQPFPQKEGGSLNDFKLPPSFYYRQTSLLI